MRESPVIGSWGIKACFKIFFTGKIGDLYQQMEKKIAEHSKCVAPLSSAKNHFTNLAYESRCTGACSHSIVNDRILMKYDHNPKIVANPHCLMPLMAINGDVGNRNVLQSFCNNGRQGKTWYLSRRRVFPQGRCKGPHREPKRRP